MKHAGAPFEAEITDEATQEVLKGIDIPPCPAVVLALVNEARNPNVDFKKVARMIGGDVGLAASVLNVANSPYFGLRVKVHSVQPALSILGLQNLLKIVYGITLKQSLGHGGKVTMERFWDRSVYKPIAVASLAAHLSRLPADDAYTFGLFYDMGIAVLMQQLDRYKDTLARANRSSLSFTRVEDESHRMNHAMVGAMLAREWQLPNTVCWAVFYHHNFRMFEYPTDYATREVCDLLAIGLMAEHVVATFLCRPDEAEWADKGELALKHFGLSREDMGALRQAITPAMEEARSYRG